MTFAGFKITRANYLLPIDQTFYNKKLEELDPNLDFLKFRSMCTRLALLANNRSDFLFEISQIAQIAFERFKNGARAHWKRLNQVIRYADIKVTSLKFPKPDMNSTRIVGYSDADFANSDDLKSQPGRITLLTDDTEKGIPIVFKSYKSSRVKRSVL